MEPIAASASGALQRPGGAAGDANAVLRDGRLLRAEVLSSTHDGAVMLAIGRHTIPAQTDLRLDPGARFLVQVVETPTGTVLALLVPGVDPEATLLAALRATVGKEPPLGEALVELRRRLVEAASPGAGDALRALGTTLDALAAAVPATGEGLRRWLLLLGGGHEAMLARASASGPREHELEGARADLKGRLLLALAALAGGGDELRALREALGRALTSLEAEQLLNLARERSGEPLVLSFPVPDGDGLATARLLVPARRERSAETDEEAPPFRLSLGLELSNLGPLRADLVLAPGALVVRMVVTKAELVPRIERVLGELRARLGDGRRPVELGVRLGTRAEALRGLAAHETRYLREHSLMDLAG